MKRIFLAICLFAGLATTASAQAPIPHPAPPVVSKTDFIAKVSQLNTLINDGNIPSANAKWNEINDMINSEMVVVRYKLQDAMDAHNDADKAHYIDLSKSQRTIFSQVLPMKSDLVTNKVQINTKLNSFAETII